MYAAGKWKIRVFSWTYSVEVDVHVVVDVDGCLGAWLTAKRKAEYVHVHVNVYVHGCFSH